MPLPPGATPDPEFGLAGLPKGAVPDASPQAKANLARIAAGQDIPPNSPLADNQSSAAARFFERLGLPSTPAGIKNERAAFANRYGSKDPSFGSRLATDALNAPADFAKTTAGVVGGPFQAGARYPADLYSKNYAGAAGDATGVLLAALGLKGIAGIEPPPRGTPIYEDVPAKTGLATKAVSGLANMALRGKLNALLRMLPDSTPATTKRIIGYSADTPFDQPPKPAPAPSGVRPHNPQGAVFAAPPSGPAIPANGPAATAYMSNPAAVTNTAQALMQNEALLPGGTPVPDATPLAQANAVLPPKLAQGIPSPTIGFTPQAFSWLHDLIRNNGNNGGASMQFSRDAFWETPEGQAILNMPPNPVPSGLGSPLTGAERLGQSPAVGGLGIGSSRGPAMPTVEPMPHPSEAYTQAMRQQMAANPRPPLQTIDPAKILEALRMKLGPVK